MNTHAPTGRTFKVQRYSVLFPGRRIAGSHFAENYVIGSGLNTCVFVAINMIVVAGPRWESWFTISFSTIMFTAKTALNDLCIPLLKEVCNTYFCRNSTIFWSKANISLIYFRFLTMFHNVHKDTPIRHERQKVEFRGKTYRNFESIHHFDSDKGIFDSDKSIICRLHTSVRLVWEQEKGRNQKANYVVQVR